MHLFGRCIFSGSSFKLECKKIFLKYVPLSSNERSVPLSSNVKIFLKDHHTWDFYRLKAYLRPIDCSMKKKARRCRHLSYCTSTTLNQRATHVVGFFILSASIFSFDANSGNIFSKPGCAAFHARDFSANDLFCSSVVRTPPLVCSFVVIKDKNQIVSVVAHHAGFQPQLMERDSVVHTL